MKEKFNIKGMHCVSCEILLERELKKIKDIGEFKISHRKGILEMEKRGISFQKIKKAVENCGYKISNQEGQSLDGFGKINREDLFQIGAIFFLIFFGVYYISQFEIAKFFPEIGENIGLGLAFLLGVVASVSSCLALTGGIVMSFSGEYNIEKNQKRLFFHRILPQIYFHVGRIGSFAIFGGLLGLLGNTLRYSISFTGYLLILAAIVMFYTGLHILNIVRSITYFGIHFPKKFGSKINDLQRKEHPLIPGVIGALTFFLPCGFTQSMQLAAVASGSFWIGAMIMIFFALGTLPVLFLVGVGSSYVQNKNFGLFKKIVGALIVFFSLYSFNSGLTLAGSNLNINFWNKNLVKKNMAETKSSIEGNKENKIQTVRLDIDYNFRQTELHIKKNIPVRFEINAIHITSCSSEVIIPSLGLSTGKLKPGINVLEFTPTKEGAIQFSCQMGMQKGKFIVE